MYFEGALVQVYWRNAVQRLRAYSCVSRPHHQLDIRNVDESDCTNVNFEGNQRGAGPEH